MMKGLSEIMTLEETAKYLKTTREGNLESGVDLRYVQKILGHKSSKTTEIYTHVSKAGIASTKSPIDTFFKGRKP